MDALDITSADTRKLYLCNTFRAVDYFTESIRTLPYAATWSAAITAGGVASFSIEARQTLDPGVCQFRAVTCPDYEAFKYGGTCGVLCRGVDVEIPSGSINGVLNSPAVPIGRTTASCVRMGMNAVFDYNYLRQVESVTFDGGVRYYTRTGGEMRSFCSMCLFNSQNAHRPGDLVDYVI
jgi:hypothetical protein